jgi:hypothetical protein
MKQSDDNKQESHRVCLRCNRIIDSGEIIFNISISLETVTRDKSTSYIEAIAVSTLCFNCASNLLSKTITSDLTLVIPAS